MSVAYRAPESDPVASAAITALDARLDVLELGTPLFVSPIAPSPAPAKYAWIQTGLGGGAGLTLWVEDGT
jgi:hypothetical protein